MFYWILLRNPLLNYPRRENRFSPSIACVVVSMIDWMTSEMIICTFLFHDKYIWKFVEYERWLNKPIIEEMNFHSMDRRPLTAEMMIHSFFVIERGEISWDFQMHPYVFDGLTVLFPFEAYQCQIDYMKGVVECLVKVCFIFLVGYKSIFSSIQGSKWDFRKSNR